LYTPSTLEALRADFHRIPELLALGAPEQPPAMPEAPEPEPVQAIPEIDPNDLLERPGPRGHAEPEPAAQLGLF
jgi:uracil-DNA glycosylase